MELHASSHLKLDPLTSVARPGTGITKSASHALKDGFSTTPESVSPLMTSVLPSARAEPAPNATKDITSSDLHALSPPKLDPLTLVARLGTGTTKSALPALKDSSSTLSENVSPLMTSAPPTTPTEPAPNATRDSTFKDLHA